MRIALLFILAPVLAACSSVERSSSAPRRVGFDPTPSAAAVGPAGVSRSASTATSLLAADYLLDAGSAPSFAPPNSDGGIGESYTLVRLGGFEPTGDLSDFDTGFWGEVAFGRKFLVFLALEGSVGYYNVSGSAGSEVYGVPLKVDARVGLPVLILELYGGLGVGGIWAHAKADGFTSEDSFAALWDAFVGAEVGLGGFAVGLEYRYLQSGDLTAPGGVGDFQLEGSMLFLTGRLPF